MADARVLRDLAEEVEGLSKEGSFDVECRILAALSPRIKVRDGVAIWAEEGIGTARLRIPTWTRSTDDAMEMKPPRWRLANFQEEPPEIGGWRATGHRASPGTAIEGATAKTAALTITALWLRALAADLEGTDAPTV